MNYRRIFKKLTVAFAVCLIGSMPVYGAGVSDDGLLAGTAWKVSAESDAAETDTCVCRGGVKRRRDMQTCVQADRTEGETLLDSMLLHVISCFLFRIV